jgi:cyclase
MKRAWLLAGIAAMGIISAGAWAADQYPIQVVPVGKGPYNFPAGFRTDWSKVTIQVAEKLSPNLVTLHGNEGVDPGHPDASGGRVAMLYGPDGVLMVDTENGPIAEKTLKAVRTLSQAPIKVVINSHAHGDHTGGNAFFAKQGALIFSQENLRDEMSPNPDAPPRPAGAPAAPPFDPASLAVVTYKYDPATKGKPALTFHMNGETVDVIPTMPAHMGGDSVIKFEKANVIYIEDFYRNFGYPFADQGNGGSINGMFQAIDMIDSLADDKTILIPGHGTLIHKKDMEPYRKMLREVLDKVTALRKSGKSLKEVLAMDLTKPYDSITLGDIQSSKDRFIGEAYAEANGLPPIVNGRRKMPKLQ